MMTPVQRALWYIESRLHDQLSLTNVSKASGVSGHHLIRAFGKAVGMPVMRYVKRRRLSEAAEALYAGAPDIFTLALLAGYHSHEAFTRAFRDEFGVSPRDARHKGRLPREKLLVPLMLDDEFLNLNSPLIYDQPSIKVTGLCNRYDQLSKARIPALWHELDQYLGRKSGTLGLPTFGVCWNYNMYGDFDYLCGVTADKACLDSELLGAVEIEAGKYAKFEHSGHIAGIRASWTTIYDQWLPTSGYGLREAPEFEYYSPDFDPVSGAGTVSIHIPVR